MAWPWRKKRSAQTDEEPPSSTRQRWNRTPRGLDAVGGYMPDLEKVDEGKAGEVYPDEIDPAWADSGDKPAEPPTS